MDYHLPASSQPQPGLKQVPGRRKRSTKRQTVHVSIWFTPNEKKELARVAESEGISVSRTGRAIVVDGLRQKLRLEREVLSQPILEAFFDKKMNRLMNRLSELLARSVYETGQLRWLYVNTLYHDILRRIAAETDIKKKEQLSKDFYTLLDTSQKETIKSVKQWSPNTQDVVAAIKQWLKEGEDKQT